MCFRGPLCSFENDIYTSPCGVVEYFVGLSAWDSGPRLFSISPGFFLEPTFL